MPSFIDSQETVDWDGMVVVIVLKIAGSRAARQSDVIYQCVARVTVFYAPSKPNPQTFNLLAFSSTEKKLRIPASLWCGRKKADGHPTGLLTEDQYFY
jgi:hypothetical protein